MRKLIASINMTIDGYCDHTAVTADAELHDHYTSLLRNAGTLLYGRITYHLMESFWPSLVKNPTGEKSMDDFAQAIENVPKIVFSRTLTADDPTLIGWKNVTLAKQNIKDEVLALKQSGTSGSKDIYIGSPSLIVALTNLHLIDEYQLCVHPVLAGKGLPLFKSINNRSVLKLVKTKVFGSGPVLLYYEPTLK